MSDSRLLTEVLCLLSFLLLEGAALRLDGGLANTSDREPNG